MRELHAIGLTPDGQHLLLAASADATKASHRVVVDKRFEAVFRGQRVDDPASGPALSVSDLQARLRAGASVEEVAAAAGLPVSRVERFAGPILSEREETLRKVFDAVQVGRRGTSTVPLGRAVAIAMEDVPNVRLDTVEWTAYKKADGVWVAAVSVSARGRTRRAEWSLDDAARTVKPIDAWASSLGHVEAAVKPAPAKVTQASAKTVTAAQPAAKTPARRVAAKAGRPAAAGKKVPAKAGRAATKQAPAKTAVKTPPVKTRVVAPRRAAAVRTPAVRTPAVKAPAVKAPAVKAPASKAPVGKTPASKAPARSTPAKVTTATRASARPAGGARRSSS